MAPLIATILLIVVAIAIIAIVLFWGKSFTNEYLFSVEDVSYIESDLRHFLYITNSAYFPNKLDIKNNHQKKPLEIFGYRYLGVEKYHLLNNKINILNEPVLISPNGHNQIDLGCTPQKEFIVEFLTTDNEFISYRYNSVFYNENLKSCVINQVVSG